MTLAEWLKTNRITQDAFGLTVGLTQSRVSQIIANGTRDLETAKRIEKATERKVRIADVVPPAWRDAFEAEGDAA